MTLLSGSYDVAMRALRRASPLLASGSSKLAVGLRGRAGAGDVLEAWAREGRDRERPLVWMHAPSVGEGLQAKAVLEALLEVRADLQSVYTFFSPSAVVLRDRMPSDVGGYLPWDVSTELAGLLGAVSPNLIAFTQTEVWPGLTAAAAARRIPVVLCAATLAAGAGRLRPWSRALLGPTFGSLAKVLAISPEDGRRFGRLGVPESRIEVTGDPAVDSAWQRAHGGDPRASHLRPFRDLEGPVLVAGSTWSADESILARVIAALREMIPTLTTLIAPHEPTEEHLTELEGRLREAGLESERLGVVEWRGEARDAPVILVDRVGVLADLYGVGSVAYVGGGFHGDGLHSVLEPAAAGCPVVFGPRCESSHAAGELIRWGGARSVAGEADLTQVLASWLENEAVRREVGSKALGYVEKHRGAAERTARILAECLSSHEGVLSDGGGS
jgi:3-deoxy-D-manno-octulosonic-acid transferase